MMPRCVGAAAEAFNHPLTISPHFVKELTIILNWTCASSEGSNGRFMRTIAFLSQKGGAGKTTLAASLAVAAAGTGERVIAFDLDPQASLVSRASVERQRRQPNNLVIEPLESERLPQLHAILEGLAEAGFTIAVFDTTPNGTAARLIALAADICLLPTRPTRLDVEVTATTFRAAWPGKAQSHVPPQPLPAYPP